ncbi:PepSY domain-containing protein [Allopusillimonas ginsengisoli]|uniref:PepSY domain-containing protein n=1 Tax=Allopusillimonas ginsengisoli TaxID=453575 RepID=UPI0010C1CB2D|nr:PepSY domain-containing protein [Alcaligenaceae bacterium]TKR55128.1 PepSY domain-containing protein [Allopusillimonas ginsengisoli]
MKPLTLAGAALAGLIISSTALADDHCTDPVADWQPREVLRQQLEQHGWTVNRIKVDDGCYEVKGVDKNGNKFEAKYAPASLQIRKLEIKFKEGGGDAADYLDKNPDQSAR